MEEALEGSVRELVFDLDKVGVSEWKGDTPKKVVIPASTAGDSIHHGVNRNLKHVPIVKCIEASGEHPIPDLIQSQGWESLGRLARKIIEFGVFDGGEKRQTLSEQQHFRRVCQIHLHLVRHEDARRGKD
jgi:hypothetical protein